jgi:two-component sensor histidine kinase/ligand-binding sensor domain-containing protein
VKRQIKYLAVIFCVLLWHFNARAQSITTIVYKDTFAPEFFDFSKAPVKLYPQKFITKTNVTKKRISKKNTYNLQLRTVSLKDSFSVKNGQYNNKKIPFGFEAHEITNVQVKEMPDLHYKDRAHSNIKYLDRAHGLFSNVIIDINQSPDGRIWLLSEHEGLGIYNSRKLTHLTMRSGLPSDNLRTSFLDSKGNMWIATDNGICYIKDNKIYTPRNQIDYWVFSITEDAEGSIWFGTFKNGLFKIEKDTLVSINSSYISGSKVHALHTDKDNNLWIGTDNFGIVRYNGKTYKNHIFYEQRNEDSCIDIHENEHGLWFSFFDAPLILYNNNEFLECTFNNKTYFRIFNISENNSGLWLADYLSGVYRLDFAEKEITLYTEDNGIGTYAVYGVFADNNENIWVYTFLRGVYRIDRQPFSLNNVSTEIPLKVARDISTIGEQVWYAPDGGKLTKQEGDFIYQYVNTPIDDEAPFAYYYDAHFTAPDIAWIPAFGQGILYFTAQNFTFYIFEKLKYFTLVSSFDDEVFYFTTNNNGLVKYEAGSFSTIDKTHGLASHSINCITHDSRGNVWIGYLNAGIGIISDNSIAHIDTSHGLSDNRVNDIYEDDKKRIWLACENGLNIIQNNKIAKLDLGNGFTSSQLVAVNQDKYGNFWIMARYGIIKLTETKANTFNVKNYGPSYGLYMNDFLYDIEFLPNDNIVFCKQSGFVNYNPKFDKPEKTEPILNIDKIIFNRDTLIYPEMNKREIFEIDAGTGFFAEFTGVLWNNEGSLRYFYSLINSKNDTVLYGSAIDNSLQIHGVKSGKYTLVIETKSLEGLSDSLSLNLNFLPYWWQTFAAKAGLVFLMALLVWLSVQLTLRRQKIYRQRLEAEVQNKTKELVEKNRINEALLSEVHHRVKNNLQKISSLIYLNLGFISNRKHRNILLEVDLRLYTMALIHEMLYSKSDFDNIPIKDYLNELLGSIEDILNSGQYDINYLIDIHDETFNVSNCVTLGMFTNEAVTNAIKYAFKNTAQPEIRVSFVKQDGYFIYSIKDNGCGIETGKKSKENSFGMKLFDIFARQVDAKLSIISENGTEIKLLIPEKSLK